METLFIGKNSLFLHEVESTNTYAMNLLRNVNTIEGTVVYTDNQTNGKGQRGALWTSKIGQNITMSIILKPQFLDLNKTFYLSKISALAIYDLLTDIIGNSQYDIKIKWPNDILVNKKKIAGILIENNFSKSNIQNSVIGIGLNVNQDEFIDLERFATSMKLLKGEAFDREFVMKKIFLHFEKWYLRLKQQEFDVIDENYQGSLYGINKILDFEDLNKNLFKGKIVGVTCDGKLQIESLFFDVKEFDIKELKFLF